MPVAEGNRPPDEEALWLRNLSSENIWFEKSGVSDAECAHYAKLAKENRAEENHGERDKSTPNAFKSNNGAAREEKETPKGEAKTKVSEEPVWKERLEVLEAEKAHHEKLALRRRPEEEERWIENLKRELVWFDRLEVMEAERNHYAKLAREQNGSEVGTHIYLLINAAGMDFQLKPFLFPKKAISHANESGGDDSDGGGGGTSDGKEKTQQPSDGNPAKNNKFGRQVCHYRLALCS